MSRSLTSLRALPFYLYSSVSSIVLLKTGLRNLERHKLNKNENESDNKIKIEKTQNIKEGLFYLFDPLCDSNEMCW